MNHLRTKAVVVREKRLQALSAYAGELAALSRLAKDNPQQRIRTFTQTTVDDIISSLRLISGMADTAAVIHAPRGCAASQLYFGRRSSFDNPWIVTNLSERDTIMGGEDSLRDAITILYKSHHPQWIFVIATPVVAINNDDIASVTEELRDELGIHIIPVYTDGFKSKTSVSGYDAVLHALLKYLPLSAGEPEPFVNILALTETPQDLVEIKRLLHALELTANILPQTATPQNVLRAPRAKASIGVNPDDGEYLGRVLAEFYQVPFLQSVPPIGRENTRKWLTALGGAVGLEQEAAVLHRRESERIAALIPEDALAAVRLYINLPAALAWAVADLAAEWGAEVVGLTVHHIDQLQQARLATAADRHPELPLHVAEGQPFELANILGKLAPDVYIGSADDAVWAAKAGIPSIAVDNLPLLGYQGMVALHREFRKLLANPAFVQNLQQHSILPYREAWYGKKPNWHIKIEVK